MTFLSTLIAVNLLAAPLENAPEEAEWPAALNEGHEAGMDESEKIPAFESTLLGLTPEEVTARFQGKAPARVNDAEQWWSIPLGPGAHQERRFTAVTFREGRAVSVRRVSEPIGCVLVPMDEPEL